MNFLPSYKEMKAKFLLSNTQANFIEKSREITRNILNGNDSRLLLIVGPCSIHDSLSAKEFAQRLHSLQVDSQFFVVMRAYCEKPRTSLGWKGFFYDPFLDGSYAIREGIEQTRQLLIELASLEIPVATEFLDPMTAYYYDDLITWGSIGARTSSSQPHRQLASHLSMPIGFKNGMTGNITAAIHGVVAASKPTTCIQLNEQAQLEIIHTKGNVDAHVVLRGGETGPNYHSLIVKETLFRLEKANLKARLLIDCSHQNSGKNPSRQSEVFQSVLHQIKQGNKNIRGIMLESHLFGGQQEIPKDLSSLKYGVSLTDSCLDWETTSQIIQWGASMLQEEFSLSFSSHSQIATAQK
jgi:3-deoxy-7-phosphoheptulonate synthase